MLETTLEITKQRSSKLLSTDKSKLMVSAWNDGLKRRMGGAMRRMRILTKAEKVRRKSDSKDRYHRPTKFYMLPLLCKFNMLMKRTPLFSLN